MLTTVHVLYCTEIRNACTSVLCKPSLPRYIVSDARIPQPGHLDSFVSLIFFQQHTPNFLTLSTPLAYHASCRSRHDKGALKCHEEQGPSKAQVVLVRCRYSFIGQLASNVLCSQACERQMRDENGFKCHVQSESHVRQMLVIGDNSGKVIKDYTRQFLHDLLQLLRTSHGTKSVNLNHFYQEYIANKIHIHMNSTSIKSLTELGKYLGREGLCRVEEGEKGLEVAWIDNSPEALRRQDALRKKERMERGDEEREDAEEEDDYEAELIQFFLSYFECRA